MNASEPLLKVGMFGVHIVLTPSGRYGFAGTVPQKLDKISTTTYEESYTHFVDWFSSLDSDDKTKHYSNLRDDVKAQLA